MLRLLAQVRVSERRETYASFSALFGIMASHALLETARDVVFLSKLPPDRLPWVFLTVALVSMAVYGLQQCLPKRDHRARLRILIGFSALLTLAFWLLLDRTGMWLVYALYTWSGVFVTLIVVDFWSLLGDYFTVGQAKRLFAFIGAGSVLGAVFGSALARFVTAAFEPKHLIVTAAGTLLLTLAGPMQWLPAPDKRRASTATVGTGRGVDLARPLRLVSQRPYLRRVAAIVLLSTLTFTCVDYVFKSSVARNVAPEALGMFFSTTYLTLNVLSLVVQLFVVGWLVRTLGVNYVHAVVPAFLGLAALGVVAGGGLVAAVVLRGFDGALRHSLHRTATEVLYVPLSGELRSAVKGFIDVLGQRGGQAVASLAILALVTLGIEGLALPAALVLLALLWVRVTRSMRSSYLDLFRESLHEVAIQSRIDFPELDLASFEALLVGLNSSNDAEVIAALELLAEQRRERVVPALILYHPSAAVVIRALELFTRAGRDDFTGILERLLEHGDPEVRAAALRTRAWVAAPSPELYDHYVHDASAIVRATALVGQMSYGGESAAGVRLVEIAKDGSDEEKLALARAVRYSPGAGYEDVLLLLAASDAIAVRLAAARAMREIRSSRFTPALMKMLPHRALRNEARRTLVAIGPDALEALNDMLGNQASDPLVRRQMPRVISSFAPEQASVALVRHLRDVQDGSVRYRIIRALGRLRSLNPDLKLDNETIGSSLASTLDNVLTLMDWRLTLLESRRGDPARMTEVQELMLELLRHKETLAMERLFHLLGLLYPREDLRTIYRGWRSANRQLRASAAELLEHLLRPPLREPVLALVDEVDDVEKLRRARPARKGRTLSYEQLLENLLDKGGVGMRCLVIYHIGELRLEGLRDKIAMLPSDLEGLVSRAVERTLGVLDTGTEDRLARGS